MNCCLLYLFFFLMIRRPPRSTPLYSSAASDVYKRQVHGDPTGVSLLGWANPAVGQLSSGFGPRSTGIEGASTYHLGQDISNDCRTPLHAAAAGTVTFAGLTSYGN